MKKQNIIILGILAVGVYFYFYKKKKDKENILKDSDIIENELSVEPIIIDQAVELSEIQGKPVIFDIEPVKPKESAPIYVPTTQVI